MHGSRPLPSSIGGLAVPRDEVSEATWRWANRALPSYLLAHSVRSYYWAADIARHEGWDFDQVVLWNAALIHDFALTRIPRNSSCFEFEGAAVARRLLARFGLSTAAAEVAAKAIVDHMRAGVTLADGVESVLLDRATGLDVRGDGFELVERVRPAVVAAYPRAAFDRLFLRAIAREAAMRPGCESSRLLRDNDLAGWLARSPWLP
jgi:HD domain